MTLGFIGVGAIAEALIVGMLEADAFDGEVLVSERNRERTRMLAERFSQVKIESSNQSIVDQSDWVFIAVLPDQAEQVLESIKFRKVQFVISLVAGRTLASLSELVAPAINVFRIIPLPPIDRGVGPLPITPPNDDIAALFDRFGTAIQVEDEDQFSAFSAASAVMASFYQFVAMLAGWIEDQGVSEKEASAYATSMIRGLSETTVDVSPSQLQAMAKECLTEGGLNEQVLNESNSEEWFEQMASRLSRIAARLNVAKKSGTV